MSRSILDEYIKKRQGGTAVYNPQTSQYGRPGGNALAGVRPQSPAQGYMGEKAPVYKPPTVYKPYTPKPQTQETGTGLDATPPTDSTGSNVLTWDDQIDIEIQNAAKKVLEVANRKFQYSTHESPIYSIMRQEYLKEADLAAGRATAAAAQNAGGFGSSFAVMAGEEARRQVMEGFYDQEDELYAAAQSEFEAERASAFDNYLRLRELKAMEQERLKTEAGASDGLTETASAAAQDLQTAFGTDYSEKTQREYLASKGYSEADINAALESQRKLASGTVTDYKAGTITDAAAQSQSFDEAFRQGTLTVEEYDAAKANNSKVIMDSVYKGLERIEDTDYAALGISDEEWSGMNDGEKKLAIFDSVGEMAKAGVVTSNDFYKLLYSDIREEFTSEDYKKSKNQTGDIMAVAEIIDEYFELGYLSEDDYINLLYNEVGSELQKDPSFKKMVTRVKGLQSRDEKDVTIGKMQRNFGNTAFPNGLDRKDKKMLMKMANRYASLSE
jgi:hypothetical protein